VTIIESDIRSTPDILRQTIRRVDEHGDEIARALQGPLVFLGSGSSYCIGVAAASLYERGHGNPAQSILGSEFVPRPGWTTIGISRTGQTTELVEAMRRARAAGVRVLLIGGEAGAPALEQADTVLPLEFATEEGVVQTRFITAALLTVRLLIGGEEYDSHALPDQMERELQGFDPASFTSFEHVVFLGRHWRLGLALSAALNLEETALMAPEAHQTLDYRHGPIAVADERTLVWCFDPPDDETSAAVLDDVRRTGATVRCENVDPLVSLVQAQLMAVRFAERRGVNPDEPRNLSRAIVLPGAEG
jgi:fructoselysine-6-P-deglycase FrlB-like protein